STAGDRAARRLQLPGLQPQVLEPREVGPEGARSVVVHFDRREDAVDVRLPERVVGGIRLDLLDQLEGLVDVLGREPRELETSEDLADRLLELDDVERLQVAVTGLALVAGPRLVEALELLGA